MDEGLEGGTKLDALLRNKKIIVIVLVVLLLLVGGGFLLWQSGTLGGGGRVTSLQRKYNSYINYVVTGEESNEQPELYSNEMLLPYFEDLSENELSVYLEKANNKYLEFSNEYIMSEREDPADIGAMEAYFQDYAEIIPFSEDELLEMYLDVGRQEALEAIEERYTISSENEQLVAYVNASKEALTLYLSLLVSMNGAGCINNGVIISGCYVGDNDTINALNSENTIAMNAINELQVLATEAAKKIYGELYGELPTDEVIEYEDRELVNDEDLMDDESETEEGNNE